MRRQGKRDGDFSNEFQPRLRASRAGTFNVYATLDRIQSNTITVILGEP